MAVAIRLRDAMNAHDLVACRVSSLPVWWDDGVCALWHWYCGTGTVRS